MKDRDCVSPDNGEREKTIDEKRTENVTNCPENLKNNWQNLVFTPQGVYF